MALFLFNKMAEKKQRKKISIWKISTFVLIILLIASVLTAGFGKTVSKQKAAQKAIDYIDLDLKGLGYNAVLKDVVSERGLYRIVFTINGVESGELNSYVTRDGKLLFPFSYDLDKPLPEIPQEVLNQEPQEVSVIPTNP